MTFNNRHINVYDFSDNAYFTNPPQGAFLYTTPKEGWYEIEAYAHCTAIDDGSGTGGAPNAYLSIDIDYGSETAYCHGCIDPLDSSAYYIEHFHIGPEFFYIGAGIEVQIMCYASRNSFLCENAVCMIEYHEELKEV